MGEETHSRHPRPQLLVDALSIGVQPALLDSAQSRGGGGGSGSEPCHGTAPFITSSAECRDGLGGGKRVGAG